MEKVWITPLGKRMTLAKVREALERTKTFAELKFEEPDPLMVALGKSLPPKSMP
jgi:hypothetical protein